VKENCHEFLCREARVRVCNDKIEVLSDPAVSYFPCVEANYKVKHIDRDAVKRIVKMKIEGFEFCSCNWCFDDKLVVPFGSQKLSALA